MDGRRLNLNAAVVFAAVAIGVAVAYVGHGSTPIVLAAFGLPLLAILGHVTPEVVLALFLVSGQFTVSGIVDVDVGVLLGVALGAVIIMRILEDGLPTIPLSVVMMLSVAVLVLLGVTYSQLPGYGVAKGLRFGVLGVLAMLGPLVIIRDEASLRRLMRSLWIVGACIAAAAVILGIATGSAGRLVSFGGGPITLGRLSGVGLACALVVFLSRDKWRYLAVASMPVLTVGLLGSGSRGPVLAALVASSVWAVGIAARRGTRGYRLAGVIAAILGVVAVTWRYLPESVLNRYALLVSSNPGASVAVRGDLMRGAFRVALLSPLTGAGTGSFGAAARVTPFLYPHNMIAEVVAENGLLVAGLLVVGLMTALVNAVRIAWERRSAPWWSVVFVMVFMVANAMFSGDLNDNQILFAFASIAAMSWPRMLWAGQPSVDAGTHGTGQA